MRLDFCALCGEGDPAALEHHHFRPKALGGSDEEKNIFTVCGKCHGDIHDIPRPLRLGELIKVGQAKAQNRSAVEYAEIAARNPLSRSEFPTFRRQCLVATVALDDAGDWIQGVGGFGACCRQPRYYSSNHTARRRSTSNDYSRNIR